MTGDRGAMLVSGWLHPQDYSGSGRYRPPARWYRLLNHVGVPLTTLGLAPKDAVTLQVKGRRTGRPRRIPVLVTRHEGKDFLVALAGESQWVRNVRAAGGAAVIRRRGTRRVRLVEVPVEERAPVLAAYLEAGRRRSGEPAATMQAKWYFGLDGTPAMQQLAALAPRYPVFLVAEAEPRHGRPDDGCLPVREIAPDVVCVGPWGRTQTTVYLIRSDSGGVLVDAGWAGDAERIAGAVEALLGPGNRPQAVLLTHAHPDHSGAARHLADRWSCPVYLHPKELPIAIGDFAAMRAAAGPLDRWLVLPVMRAIGRRRRQAMLAAGSLAGVARALPPDGAPPGLPGWQVVPTPGHTPGHVSLFRATDRVLISGDALVNLPLNSVRGLLGRQQGLSGPPWYTTWNRAAALISIRRLAALEPAVLGSGHGQPVTGPDTHIRIQRFADALGDLRPPRLGGRTAMTRITGAVMIDAPITVVFDTVADERNEPRYNPRISHVELLTDGPVGAGARFLVEPQGIGSRAQMTMEIVEYDRPHRVHNMITSSAMRVDGTLSLEETQHGTRLSWDWSMQLVGPLRVLTPVLALVGPRWEHRNWVGLRDYWNKTTATTGERRDPGGRRPRAPRLASPSHPRSDPRRRGPLLGASGVLVGWTRDWRCSGTRSRGGRERPAWTIDWLLG